MADDATMKAADKRARPEDAAEAREKRARGEPAGAEAAPVWSEPIEVEGYQVRVGAHVAAEFPALLHALCPKAAVFVVISDRNVMPLYGAPLADGLEALGRRALRYEVLPGEASKDRLQKAAIEDWMIAQGCARDCVVVAVGGGVVGDLAGFVASTYFRGVPYVQVPTSMLAVNDSSVGGKTAVDVPLGKNLIGAFYRPLVVLVDVAALRTLPAREFCNGMAEVVKHAAIASAELFALLEDRAREISALDEAVLLDVIRRSIAIKADVVTRDFREGGVRAILNAGHSVGHAVESLLAPRMLHGECVAVGLVAEARLSRQLGHLAGEEPIRRLEACLRQYSLPTAMPAGVDTGALLDYLARDKKNRAGVCRVVMLTGIGEVRREPYTTGVERERLAALLSATFTVDARPGLEASGRVAVPGSKSISNRALLAAALATGTCRLRGLLHSDDTAVMLAALRQMGVRHETEDGGDTVVVHGSAGRLEAPAAPLYLKNAGTASRFLTSAVCLAGDGTAAVELTGNARMRQRPVGDLVDALRRCGVEVEYLGTEGSLPLRVRAPGGGLPGGALSLSASVSSQYVSSLLLSAPYARADTLLRLEGGSVVSEPYILMTGRLMAQFGVNVMREDLGRSYRVPAGAGYVAPPELQIEGDASSATYPLALAAITGGTVTVTNVGSASVQGDARFCNLLARMGCDVRQTDGTTTVRGPEGGAAGAQGLAGLGTVDLADMTDTFMTLAALAAVARGTTRIVNIENQRVKECNRLAAMASELRKMGVRCAVLRDGIEIEGSEPQKLRGAPIHCYDDHRIAMSFAVLGAVVPGVHILDKACTGKTYPGFWDDLERCFGLGPAPGAWADAERAVRDGADAEGAPEEGDFVEGGGGAAAGAGAGAGAAGAGAALGGVPPTVFFVGMRGSGKTTLGRATARRLGLRFVDLDEELERALGVTIKEYLASPGGTWAEFRRRELSVLREAVRRHGAGGALVSCGGGVVETPAAVAVLRRQPFVVQLARHIDDVEAYLERDGTRPQYAAGASPREVYARRRALYAECSRYEFCARRGERDAEASARDLAHFCCTVLGLEPVFPPHAAPSRAAARPLGDGTFFLSLTFPRVEEAVPLLPEVSRGADALELRVDLLERHRDEAWLREQLALLRRHTTLPVVWTVRTRAEGGAFDGTPGEAARLAALGLRLGCRLVDAEAAWPAEALSGLFSRRGRQEVIVSAHVPGGNGGTDRELRDLFVRCHAGGLADVVKVVVAAREPDDALRLLAAERSWRATLSRRAAGVRTIVLAMGEAGKLSRVLNRCLTPVTHPALPAAAAPGQLSAAEIGRQREALGVQRPLRYHLFGTPVALSPSPAMHNAAFERCELPHRYSLRETDDLDEVRRAVAGADFGGASVTIPLKERVAPLLDELSDAARAIGAVNTLVRLPASRGGGLRGENTDWVGIACPLLPLVAGAPAGARALVVGAGGTARAALYALQQLGFRGASRLSVANPRTPARAEALAAEFGCAAGFPAAAAATPLAAVVCTLPGTAGYRLPEGLLAGAPAVVDVSYLPKTTPLQEQALAAGCPLVRGIDMLVAQGVEAFHLWTGRASGVAEALDAGARAHYATLD